MVPGCMKSAQGRVGMCRSHAVAQNMYSLVDVGVDARMTWLAFRESALVARFTMDLDVRTPCTDQRWLIWSRLCHAREAMLDKVVI